MYTGRPPSEDKTDQVVLLQAKEHKSAGKATDLTDLRRNQPCQYLDLTSSLQNYKMINFCGLSHSSTVLCFGSPSKVIQ